MRRFWAGAVAGAAMLVVAGCGSGASGAGWSAPGRIGAAGPALTDPVAIDGAVADARAGGHALVCDYTEREYTGTFVIGPGETVWMELDPGVGAMIQDSEFSMWLRGSGGGTGIRIGPEFAAEMGIPELTADDPTGGDGELTSCRTLDGDRPGLPADIDFTAVDGQGDLIVWLADTYNDRHASTMFDRLSGDSRSERGQAMFYLGLGMLMGLSDAETQRYGALSDGAQQRYWQDLTAGMTARQHRAYIDEAIERLRPEHQRLVRRALED